MFLACGVQERQMGLITVYRAQLKLLNQMIKPRTGIEALTADRFQGRDKDCVIISLVRSNQEGNIGELLNDWRRLNVSFTRAKSKLIMVGSRKTLERDPRLKQFLGLIDQQQWSYDLPSNCTDMYDIPPPLSMGYSPVKRSQFRTPKKMSHPKSPSSPSSSKSKKLKSPVRRHTAGDRVLEAHPLLKDIANELK